MGRSEHPAASSMRPDMDTECRDCGRVFAGLIELVAHYDQTCRPPDRHVAAGSRHRPNNVIQVNAERWRRNVR